MPLCSAYVPAFLGASALCFPEGYSKTGLTDDIKFKVSTAQHSAAQHSTATQTKDESTGAAALVCMEGRRRHH